MKYVDAGYAICLGVLFLYAASVVVRRRRLGRADALRASTAAVPGGAPTPPGPTPPGPTPTPLAAPAPPGGPAVAPPLHGAARLGPPLT